MLKKKLEDFTALDDTENTLLFQKADDDGFHLCEIEGKGKVYVYYSEIDLMIERLKEWKKKGGA